MISAQKRLSEIVVQKREVENYKPSLQTPESPVENQIPRVVPDERTRQWADRNEWFDKDSVMRGAAFAIHDELVRSGYTAGSDAYFEQVVAPASRSPAGSKKVSLTKSEVAVAKRLNLSLEEYAASKLRLMEKNNG
jgi:hypothetical protein